MNKRVCKKCKKELDLELFIRLSDLEGKRIYNDMCKKCWEKALTEWLSVTQISNLDTKGKK